MINEDLRKNQIWQGYKTIKVRAEKNKSIVDFTILGNKVIPYWTHHQAIQHQVGLNEQRDWETERVK